MLDVHRLRIFRSVVASGSVHAAAANLGFSPSAISQHLTALQRETGLMLVERAGRGLRPTTAGLALAADADDVLARLGEAEALVADLRAGRTGSLSIGYFASVGSVWLPAVVKGLQREFPQLRVELRLTDDVPERAHEQADVQLVVGADDYGPPPGFVTHHLIDDPYVVALPTGHPLADQQEVELADLAGECWIDNDFAQAWCRRVLTEACAAAGFTPSFRVEAHDYPTALAFVEAGIGITVLPQLGAAHVPTHVTVLPVVRPTPLRAVYAVVRDAATLAAPARVALDLLRDIAREPVAGGVSTH